MTEIVLHLLVSLASTLDPLPEPTKSSTPNFRKLPCQYTERVSQGASYLKLHAQSQVLHLEPETLKSKACTRSPQQTTPGMSTSREAICRNSSSA